MRYTVYSSCTDVTFLFRFLFFFCRYICSEVTFGSDVDFFLLTAHLFLAFDVAYLAVLQFISFVPIWSDVLFVPASLVVGRFV